MRSLALLILILSAPAWADERLGDWGPDRYRTQQDFILEFRFGPYRPDVDSEFGGARQPYNDTFGGGSGFLFALELDYQFFQRFGSLAIGGSAGYMADSAPAQVAGGTGSTGDTTGFRLVPLGMLLVYRFDVLARRWGIPFVPYGKVGLVYDLWWITNGRGDIASTPGMAGRGFGGTWGYTVAGGVALLLDGLDPSAAVALDSELGINHTYIFFEVDKVVANGLWRDDALHVGDTTWALGLSFEF